MNQTSATGNAAGPIADATAVVTTAHLALIVVLAVLVVIGIIYGARVKYRRVEAERRAVEHAVEAGVAPVPVGDTSAARPAPSSNPAPSPVDQPMVTAPAPSADVASAASEDGTAGPSVSQLKGLGPKVAARLAELGITTVGQIAALDHDAAQALDAELGPFRGRLERDRWVEQARFLAAGDRAGFEAVFGKL